MQDVVQPGTSNEAQIDVALAVRAAKIRVKLKEQTELIERMKKSLENEIEHDNSPEMQEKWKAVLALEHDVDKIRSHLAIDENGNFVVEQTVIAPEPIAAAAAAAAAAPVAVVPSPDTKVFMPEQAVVDALLIEEQVKQKLKEKYRAKLVEAEGKIEMIQRQLDATRQETDAARRQAAEAAKEKQQLEAENKILKEKLLAKKEKLREERNKYSRYEVDREVRAKQLEERALELETELKRSGLEMELVHAHDQLRREQTERDKKMEEFEREMQSKIENLEKVIEREGGKEGTLMLERLRITEEKMMLMSKELRTIGTEQAGDDVVAASEEAAAAATGSAAAKPAQKRPPTVEEELMRKLRGMQDELMKAAARKKQLEIQRLEKKVKVAGDLVSKRNKEIRSLENEGTDAIEESLMESEEEKERQKKLREMRNAHRELDAQRATLEMNILEIEELRLQKSQKAVESLQKMRENLLQSAPDQDATRSVTELTLAERITSKLEKLEMLDQILKKLDNMPAPVFMAGMMTGMPTGPVRSANDIRAEMQEVQTVLMDSTTTPQVVEDANIRLEKLIQELERTPEFKEEQRKLKEEKRKKNEPLNKDALERMKLVYTATAMRSDAKIRQKVQDSPELRLITMNPGQIIARHANDFKAMSLRGITLDEIRAIAGVLPAFRRDQQVQIEFAERVEAKIDEMAEAAEKAAANPPAAKPKAAAK